MRLRIVLPKVNPEAITVPTRCSYAGCNGRKFHLRKARHESATRYGLSGGAGASLSVFECKRTFRVYPEWTTPAQTSQRVKGLAVKLYLLPKPFNYGVSLLDGSQSPDLMPRLF